MRTMADKTSIIPVEANERRILLIRCRKVMLDSDLAQLYGVSTKRLNEQVKRIVSDSLLVSCSNSQNEKNQRWSQLRPPQEPQVFPCLPYAFTEHGAIMLASVLNSTRA